MIIFFYKTKERRLKIKNKKNIGGITLIALVITIIVLLILAGVSIATLTGENGILSKAGDARTENSKAEEKEQILLAYSAALMEKLSNNDTSDITIAEIQKELKTNGVELATDKFSQDATSKDMTIKMPSGVEYVLKYNGTVDEKKEAEKKTYTVTIAQNNPYVISSISNIFSISEGEEISLTFTIDNTTQHFVEPLVYVSGAEYEIIESMQFSITILLKNPTENVTISFEVQPSCCFVKGTPVLMANGTTKNIEDIIVGDLVMTYNETTKKYEVNDVVGLITNPNTTDLARVNLVDGTSIEMNAYHPIYTQDGWKSLTGYEGLPVLTKEDKILSNNGEFINILSIERWTESTPITTYNLSIQNNHNFFVGNTAILVHNAGCAY